MNPSQPSASQQWIERRHAVVPPGVGSFAGDTTAATASGARIIDADGNELLDFGGGIGVMNIGHCDEQVVAAIREQAGRLLHACIHVATYEPYVELCERLVELLPHAAPGSGTTTKAVLLNTGAEAVENAIKIARQATGRPAVLCFSGGFHGRTLLGMTLTTKTAYKTNCGPFAPEIYRMPYPDRFLHGDGLDEPEFVERELGRLEETFANGVPAEHLAAVLIEPVLGEGGFVPAPFAYMRGLRETCDRYGILLVCDEVQSGFCRSGRWASYEHAGILPDLSTWAKSMGGGLPIAAVLGRADVMDKALPGTLGGTFGGNPLACAAALATIRRMQELDLNKRAAHIGARVRARFDALARRCNLIAEVRGVGAMIGVELCYERDPRRPAAEALQLILDACRARGVLVLKAGTRANVIRILSPLVIEDADLERGLDVIEESVLEAAKIPQLSA